MTEEVKKGRDQKRKVSFAKIKGEFSHDKEEQTGNLFYLCETMGILIWSGGILNFSIR